MTVDINENTGNALHPTKDKKKEPFKSFFQKFSTKQIKKIKTVVIDRAGAYQTLIRPYVVTALIVLNTFHILSHLNTTVDVM